MKKKINIIFAWHGFNDQLIQILTAMSTDKKSILKEIKRIVTQTEPSAQLFLYGSRSRGTSSDQSDWDILILIDKPSLTPEHEREITYPLYDLEFDIGEVISPVVYTQKEWSSKYKFTHFYQNVMREGILL